MDADDSNQAPVEVPAALQDFLEKLGFDGPTLAFYAPTLVRLGYNSVDDFANFDADSLKRMRHALREELNVHVNKIVNAAKRRGSAGSTEAAGEATATNSDAAASEQTAAALLPPAPPPAPAPAAPPALPPAVPIDAAAAAHAAMLRAAEACAAAPMHIGEGPEEFDEDATFYLAQDFTRQFTEFAAAHPGAAGASAAAVQLLHAVAMIADRLMEMEGEEEEDDDDIDGGYGSYDEGDWRP